jgi:hypothetical protein
MRNLKYLTFGDNYITTIKSLNKLKSPFLSKING